ncbi:hypothetical protein LFL96_25940 [Paraburkholderia sp. D15]|uniref:hypothetical protein n=1 Tax=Paraburkholderia sp. D15 TaxID=2880218 RepID=UPI002479A0E5|nr:hypothetical protein [Paraburkholderia sp. D15]WGS54458.1 hypothetical protein LFL96_25940 [Paraburkholderia sp. D15]
MIEALKKFAGGFRIVQIRKTEGMEGSGWIGLVVLNGRVLGEAADYGNGGPCHIKFMRKEDNEALAAHAKTVIKDFEFETDGMFLEFLANYELAVKRLKTTAKKKLMQSDETKLDSNGVAEAYSSWSLLDTPENRAKILARYPDTKFLNDELVTWEDLKVGKKR